MNLSLLRLFSSPHCFQDVHVRIQSECVAMASESVALGNRTSILAVKLLFIYFFFKYFFFTESHFKSASHSPLSFAKIVPSSDRLVRASTTCAARHPRCDTQQECDNRLPHNPFYCLEVCPCSVQCKQHLRAKMVLVNSELCETNLHADRTYANCHRIVAKVLLWSRKSNC